MDTTQCPLLTVTVSCGRDPEHTELGQGQHPAGAQRSKLLSLLFLREPIEMPPEADQMPH